MSGNINNAPGSRLISEKDDIRLETLQILSYSIVDQIESLMREKSLPPLILARNRYSVLEIDLEAEVRNFETSLIRCALIRTGGNQRRAARLLGIKISTLNAKILRYKIESGGLQTSPDGRSDEEAEAINETSIR